MKGALRGFIRFTEKHLCQNLLFNKVAGLRPETLLKKRLSHRCFPVNFADFLRISFYRKLPDDCFYSFFSPKKVLLDTNTFSISTSPRKKIGFLLR